MEQPERDAFLDFLQDLGAGRATIAGWNQFVATRPRQIVDPELEFCRQELARQGLTIGQCAAIPFPPPLQQLARQWQQQLAPT